MITEIQLLTYLNIALSVIGLVLAIGVSLLLYKSLKDARKIESKLDINSVSKSAYKSVGKKIAYAPNKRLQLDVLRGVEIAMSLRSIIRQLRHRIKRD